MNTYVIKVALRDVSPMIWRRLRVSGKTSLADLHHIIQIAMDWNDEHLHKFRIYGEDYGIAYEGGMSFNHDAHQVILDDFGFDAGDRFTYTYNFFTHRLCDIRIERIEKTTLASPWCFGGSGRQSEDETRYYKVDEFMAMIDLLNEVVEPSGTDTELYEALEHCKSVRFSRTVVNKQLNATFHS